MDQDEARAKERAAAVAEVTARLRGRGIAVTGAEDGEDLVNLLSAVERFEAAVEAHGASSRPDDLHFVLPRRAPGEAVREYTGRIDEATARLRGHPRRPD